jgi:hypothetical protein
MDIKISSHGTGWTFVGLSNHGKPMCTQCEYGEGQYGQEAKVIGGKCLAGDSKLDSPPVVAADPEQR